MQMSGRGAACAVVGTLLVGMVVLVFDASTRERVMEASDGLIGNSLLKAQAKALRDARHLKNKGKDMQSFDEMLYGFQEPVKDNYDSLTENLKQQAPKKDDLEIALAPGADGMIHFQQWAGGENKKPAFPVPDFAEDIEFLQEDEDEVVNEAETNIMLTKAGQQDLAPPQQEDDGIEGDSVLSAVHMQDNVKPEESGLINADDIDLGLIQRPNDNSDLMKLTEEDLESRITSAVDSAIRSAHLAEAPVAEATFTEETDFSEDVGAVFAHSKPRAATFLGLGSASGSAAGSAVGYDCTKACPSSCSVCNSQCTDATSQECKVCSRDNDCQECRQCHIMFSTGHESPEVKAALSSAQFKKNAVILKAFSKHVVDKVVDDVDDGGNAGELSVVWQLIIHMAEKTHLTAGAQYLYLMKTAMPMYTHGLGKYTLKHINKAMEHGDGIIVMGKVPGKPGKYFYLSYKALGETSPYGELYKMRVRATRMMKSVSKFGAEQTAADTPEPHFTKADYNKLFKPSCVGVDKFAYKKCAAFGPNKVACKSDKDCKFAPGWNGDEELDY